MAAVAAIWVYLAIRTVDVSFTSDEALSYGIIHGLQTFVESANNQWLNTLLMRVSQAVLGASDWSFRIPNLISFGLYAGSVLIVLRRLAHNRARVIGFVVLLTDPFMLEFFGLARGYGLSVGFSAAALASCFSVRADDSAARRAARLAVAGCCGSLAFYANFAALNVVLALFAVAAIDAAVWLRRASTDRARPAVLFAAILGATAGSLVPGIRHVQFLQHIGQLYYGGHQGLVRNTIGSLAETWGYVYRYPPHAGGWWTVPELLVCAVLAAGVLWSVGRGLKAHRWSNAQRATGILVLSLAAAQLEAWVLGTLYPIDRVALTYLVAFGFFCAFVADDFTTVVRRRSVVQGFAVLTACLAVAAVVNFARAANLTYALTWKFDASARDVMQTVQELERAEGTPARPWWLVSGFPQDNALEYYRERLHLTWLERIGVDPVYLPGAALYVATKSELGSLPPGTTLIASFPSTASQLRAGPGLARDP